MRNDSIWGAERIMSVGFWTFSVFWGRMVVVVVVVVVVVFHLVGQVYFCV